VLIAFVFMELLGVKPLYEVVLERKLKVMHREKKPQIVEFSVTVKDDSFVVGKTTRDIFWPPSCLVLQIVRAGQNAVSDARMDKDGDKVLKPGDSLSLRVQTYDEPETRRLIGDLVGAQDDSRRREYMP
jgi:chloride ion channel protein, voltage-gated